MSNHVLVTYASKYGGTAGIAEKISQILTEAGLEVTVLPANRVPDPARYRAVVLGSGVYIGQWRREAANFLKANEKVLAERPVWLFSSGPTGEGDLEKLLQGWHFPAGLQAVADRIHPRDIAVFHGVADSAKMNFFDRWILKNVKAPSGDFRDWQMITAWAESIAAALKEQAPA